MPQREQKPKAVTLDEYLNGALSDVDNSNGGGGGRKYPIPSRITHILLAIISFFLHYEFNEIKESIKTLQVIVQDRGERLSRVEENIKFLREK